MNKSKFEKVSELFKALSHPVRLQIVLGLSEKRDCNVSRMVQHLNLPQPNVSQHINILKNAGIIEGYRKGNEICYNLNNNIVEKIMGVLGI